MVTETQNELDVEDIVGVENVVKVRVFMTSESQTSGTRRITNRPATG